MVIQPECPGSRPRSACAVSAQRLAVLAVVAALIVVAPAGRAAALLIGGGGSSRTDCLAVLDAPVNDPITKPKNIRCTDGDPSCDADGVVNGVCEFAISVCANSTAIPDCTLNGVQSMTVDHAADNGDPKFDTDFQALQNRLGNDINPPTTTADVCTNPTHFRVRIVGPFAGRCKKGKKLLKMTTISTFDAGRAYVDKDKVKMTCDPAPSDPNDPAPDGCDPTVLYSGTFDRIQRQIFDQSCAVSGCHDSQSRTGDLLLEQGASLTNLINVAPNNSNALAAGWKRVTVIDATTGDPGTSLLFAKVDGPPNGFGARMPFNRPKLDQTLIDVIQLWIAAGAPDTGWVAGTDQ